MATVDARARSPFWTLQLVVWPAYGLISFIGALPYVGLAPHLGSLRSVIISKAIFAAAGLLCSSSMRVLYQCEKYTSSWIRIAPAALFLSYSCGLLTTVCSNAARELASGKHLSEAWPGLVGGSINASAVFLAWSACYFAVRNYHALEKEKRDALRANAPKVVDWVTTDANKKVIGGSNFDLEPAQMAALQKRFKIEDYSGK